METSNVLMDGLELTYVSRGSHFWVRRALKALRILSAVKEGVLCVDSALGSGSP